MSNTNDSFSTAVEELNASFAAISELSTPLQTVTGVVTSLDACLQRATDFKVVFDEIDNIIDGIDDVLPLLIPVSTVGEVAGTFEDVKVDIRETTISARELFDHVNEAVITPATEVLDDVKKGIVDINKLVASVSTAVPQYLNTLNILSYLLDVATPLTEVLEGTVPSDRLKATVRMLTEAKVAVGREAVPLASRVEKITDGIHYFAVEVNKMLETLIAGIDSFLREELGYTGLKLDVDTAINGMRHAGDALDSIVAGFAQMGHSIAPVRWALDVTDLITDRILMPVIHWLMEKTGLSALVDSAEDEICKKLRVNGIFELIERGVNNDGIQSKKREVGSAMSRAAEDAFIDFTDALDNYRTSRSVASKDATLGLAAAISGTAIDPGKGKAMPDWPEVPNDLYGASQKGPIALTSPGDSLREQQLIECVATIEAIHSNKSASNSKLSPHGLASLLVTANADNPVPLPAVDPKIWPHCSALIDDIRKSVVDLTELSTTVTTLKKSLTVFDRSLVFPDLFLGQVLDMDSALGVCDDLSGSVSGSVLGFGMGGLSKLLSRVQPIIKDQMEGGNQVRKAVPLLQAAFAEVDAVANGVRTVMPKSDVIDKTIHRLEGWAIALQQLVAMMATTMEKNQATGGKYDDQVNSLTTQIEACATDLQPRLSSIDSATQAAATSTKQLQQALDSYSTSLLPLSTYSQTMTVKALPALQRTAYILGIINSVFDPLSIVFQPQNCIDGNNPIKTAAATAIKAIEDAGITCLSINPSAFDNIALDFSERTLPMAKMTTHKERAATRTRRIPP
ncbi:hypothetical protein ACFL2V_02935 [Pseudomonadota bacterium]